MITINGINTGNMNLLEINDKIKSVSLSYILYCYILGPGSVHYFLDHLTISNEIKDWKLPQFSKCSIQYFEILITQSQLSD